MAEYMTKPIIKNALQWTGNNHLEMFDFLENKPNEFMVDTGDNFLIDHSKVIGGLIIKTLEGPLKASINDYIVKGLRGEYYPVKPDIFEQSYELYTDTNWTEYEILQAIQQLQNKEKDIILKFIDYLIDPDYPEKNYFLSFNELSFLSLDIKKKNGDLFRILGELKQYLNSFGVI